MPDLAASAASAAPPASPAPDTARLERNVRLYPIYQCTWMTPFFVPVIVLFWQENGLDAFDVYALQALFAAAVVVLEVPTGVLADKVGKRESLVAGSVAIVAGLVLYSLGTGFGVFLAAEVTLALGVSFISGADTALLYDSLAALGRKEEFQRREGRARGLQMAMVAGASVVGGVVGAASTRATLWMSAAASVAGLLMARRFAAAAPARAGTDRSPRLLADTARFVRRHRLVRWYVLFLAALSGSATWLLWLYQPYMQHVGLPIWTFGLAFALFNLSAAVASHYSSRFDARLGRGGSLVALALLQVLPIVPMALLPVPASVLFILGHQAVRGIVRPLVAERVLAWTWADKRATVLSLASLAGRLFFAATGMLVGWWARELPMAQALLCQAGLLAAVLLLLLLEYRRIPAKYFEVKGSVAARQ